MTYFTVDNGQLMAEQTPLQHIAETYGTPAYVYSRAALEAAFNAYRLAFAETPHLICYAVKANSNLAVLNLLAGLGSGFDIVSVGELERVLLAGGDADKVVFSGVAKTHREIERALEVSVHCFNVESTAELNRISDVAAAHGVTAPISLRVNPDVDAQTHPYISTGLRDNKFGIAIDAALPLYLAAAANPALAVIGIDCHIGSQLTTLAPFEDALHRVLALVDQLEQHDIALQHIDVGGGLGVRYRSEQPPSPHDYVDMLRQQLQGRSQTLIIEPGRSIAANAGVLLTRVEYLKSNVDKHFAIVDAAMNDMIRPALYDAWLGVEPLQARDISAVDRPTRYDIVGPVCETGDFLARDRELILAEGDYLCVHSAGAYGFSMASNYNSRGRAVEIMIDGAATHIIRKRETTADLVRGEHLPNWS